MRSGERIHELEYALQRKEEEARHYRSLYDGTVANNLPTFRRAMLLNKLLEALPESLPLFDKLGELAAFIGANDAAEPTA